MTLSHTAGSAGDSLYADLSGDDLGVTVVARTSGALVIQLGVTTLDQELTVEEGGSGSYAVVLSHVPSGDVTVTVNDPTDNTDVTAEPASLTFSTSTWNAAQNVTVSAAEDDDATADPAATVKHTVGGGGYDGVTVPDAVVTIRENDVPGLVLSTSSVTVGEADTTGESYTVRLATRPSATTTVEVSGHGGTDLNLSGLSASSTLTFTTSNWNTVQTVRVKANADDDAVNDEETLTPHRLGRGLHWRGRRDTFSDRHRRRRGRPRALEGVHLAAGGQRDRRELHRQAGHPALSNSDRDHRRTLRHRPQPVHHHPLLHGLQLEC